MEVFKYRDFSKWAKRIGISDLQLRETILEMERGLVGDRIGAHVYKKRLSLGARGKRGGVRLIVLFKATELAVFLYGYAKNDKSDLCQEEEEFLRTFAYELIRLEKSGKQKWIQQGLLSQLIGSDET